MINTGRSIVRLGRTSPLQIPFKKLQAYKYFYFARARARPRERCIARSRSVKSDAKKCPRRFPPIRMIISAAAGRTGDTHARSYLRGPNDKISFTSNEIFHDSRSKIAVILRCFRRLPSPRRIYCLQQRELLRDK